MSLSSAERARHARGAYVTLVGRFGGAKAPDARVVGELDASGTLNLPTGPGLQLATSGATAESGPVVCVLDGFLHDAERFARQFGLPGELDDASLLARAYRQGGNEILERLRGEVALVLWDREHRHGVIARDQLGARPMFVHTGTGDLLFASEVRTLLSLLPRRPDPDRVAALQWLAGTGIGGHRTLYAGLRQLAPGGCILLAGERWEERRYWRPAYARPARVSADEAALRIRTALTASVRRRVLADEAPAVMMSGGLDSTSVAAVAAHALPGVGLRAYSGVFPDHDETDESDLIRETAAHLEIPTVRMSVRGGSPLGAALDFMETWQVPLGPPNDHIWQPLLRRAAADGTDVILDGAGGDELFGMPPYLVADRLRRLRLISAVRAVRRFTGADGAPAHRVVPALLRRYGAKGLVPWIVHDRVRRGRPAGRYAPSWFTAESAALYRDSDESWEWKRLRGPRWWAHAVFRLFDRGEALGVHDYLRRRAVTTGVRSGQPMLDLDLIELVLAIPPELSLDVRHDRPLLRHAMAGALPRQIIEGTKSHFTPLLQRAIAETDRPALEGILGAPDAAVGDLARLDVVGGELLGRAGEIPSGERSLALWRLLTLECWLRAQEDGSFPEQVRERFQPVSPNVTFVTR